MQRSQKPVNYQQRLEYILDFWFRMDDEVGIGAMLAYDRESSFPSNLKRRWFKPDDSFDAMVRQNFKQDFENNPRVLFLSCELKKLSGLIKIFLPFIHLAMPCKQSVSFGGLDNILLNPLIRINMSTTVQIM